MTLRQKLLVTFLIIILLPCVLIGGAGGLIFRYEVRRFADLNGGVEANIMSLISEPVQMLDDAVEPVFELLATYADSDPESFKDEKKLLEINAGLYGKDSCLIVIEDDDVIFSGSGEFDNNESIILDAVSDIQGDENGDIKKTIYVGGERPLIIKVCDVPFSDGPGRLIVVSEPERLVGEIKTAVKMFLILAAISVFITAFVILAWMYTGLIKPIDSLRKAAKEIGSGNLKFKLERKENDEVGELCSDFEEMRRHLKTQIDSKEQYEMDVREMVSNVSHDLKTPLTAIKGYAEGLLDGVADNPEKRNKYLKTIVVKASDMTTLVDELSYFSKLDTNKMPYKFEVLNACGYFSDCVDEYSIELEMKGFSTSFVSEIDPDTMIMLDVEQIRRVMNNLIGNAYKYRDEEKSGNITVRLTDAEDSIRVSVSDNGIGISRAALPHIFDRFYRADKSRTAGRAGTGIGLAIVRKIVEEHGGRVFARSELGIGTTISFTIKKGAKQNGNQNINS